MQTFQYRGSSFNTESLLLTRSLYFFEQNLHTAFYAQRKSMLNFAPSGGVLDSTTVTKPPVHAEMVTNLVNPKSQTYSCQRRQLRTRCLNPSRVPSDWSRAYASSVPRDTQASYLIRS